MCSFFQSALQQPGTRVRVIARGLSAISALALIEHDFFSSQHGITDAESLHDQYLEFARAGVVNHGEEDCLVAKLCEVLKYHLR